MCTLRERTHLAFALSRGARGVAVGRARRLGSTWVRLESKGTFKVADAVIDKHAKPQFFHMTGPHLSECIASAGCGQTRVNVNTLNKQLNLPRLTRSCLAAQVTWLSCLLSKVGWLRVRTQDPTCLPLEHVDPVIKQQHAVVGCFGLSCHRRCFCCFHGYPSATCLHFFHGTRRHIHLDFAGRS